MENFQENCQNPMKWKLPADHYIDHQNHKHKKGKHENNRHINASADSH